VSEECLTRPLVASIAAAAAVVDPQMA